MYQIDLTFVFEILEDFFQCLEEHVVVFELILMEFLYLFPCDLKFSIHHNNNKKKKKKRLEKFIGKER